MQRTQAEGRQNAENMRGEGRQVPPRLSSDNPCARSERLHAVDIRTRRLPRVPPWGVQSAGERVHQQRRHHSQRPTQHVRAMRWGATCLYAGRALPLQNRSEVHRNVCARTCSSHSASSGTNRTLRHAWGMNQPCCSTHGADLMTEVLPPDMSPETDGAVHTLFDIWSTSNPKW